MYWANLLIQAKFDFLVSGTYAYANRNLVPNEVELDPYLFLVMFNV